MIRILKLRCSFCRRSEKDVEKLVAGPRVYICDRCVAIATRIMDDDQDPHTSPKTETALWRKISNRLREIFGRDPLRVRSVRG